MVKISANQWKALAGLAGAVCVALAAFFPNLAPALAGVANLIGLAAPKLTGKPDA